MSSTGKNEKSDGSGSLPELLRGAAGSLAAKVAGLGLLLILNIALARLLGPAGLGYYALGVALALVVSHLSTLGTPQLLVRELGILRMRREWSLMNGLLWSSWVSVLAVSILAGVLVFLATLAARGEGLGQGGWTLIFAGALIPPLSLIILFGGVLRGFGRIVIGQLPQLVLLPALLLAIIFVHRWLWDELSAPQAMGLHVAAAVAVVLVGIWAVRRTVPTAALAVGRDYRIRAWWSSASVLMLGTNAMLINAELSTLLLGAFAEPEEVGLYRVAQKGAELSLLGLGAVNMALAPTASRLFANGQSRKLQSMVTGAARATTAFAVPFAMLLLLAGPWVLSVLFGEQYRPAALPLAILVIGQLANCVFGSVGILLNMTGHERETVKGQVMAIGVNLILCLVLIPSFGTMGAAASAAISLVAWNIYLARRLFKRTGLISHVFHRNKRESD